MLFWRYRKQTQMLSLVFFLVHFGSLFLCSLIELNKDGLRGRSHKREDLYLNVEIFEFFLENTFRPVYDIKPIENNNVSYFRLFEFIAPSFILL